MGNEYGNEKKWWVKGDVVYIPLEIVGLSGKELLQKLLDKKLPMETEIQSLFLSKDFIPAKPERLSLAIIKGSFFEEMRESIEIARGEAAFRGFDGIDLEMIVQLLTTFSSKEILEMGFGCIIFMSETFKSLANKMEYYLAIDCVGIPDLIVFWKDASILTNSYDGYVFSKT